MRPRPPEVSNFCVYGIIHMMNSVPVIQAPHNSVFTLTETRREGNTAHDQLMLIFRAKPGARSLVSERAGERELERETARGVQL